MNASFHCYKMVVAPMKKKKKKDSFKKTIEALTIVKLIAEIVMTFFGN